MIRVWFNHWFSTSYRLIELMKEDKEQEIVIIGTNRQENSVIQKVCDEWSKEPILDGEDYINYCLNFCIERHIDVFVPRKHMEEISKNKRRFEELGVKVLVDDYSIISLLGNKSKAYEYFKDCSNILIPDYYSVNTVSDFVKAYVELRKSHEKVCVKFVHDEGGMSFRKIIETPNTFEQLKFYPEIGIRYSDLYAALASREYFDDLMVMPYLSGNEISIDCLATDSGNIAIPRIKTVSRHERIVFDNDLINMAETILNKTKLRFPCNIQFRYSNDSLYLLEINTRMSGGLQMSCLAAGVNIPNIALNKLFNKNIPWHIDDCSEKIVSYIEIPKLIK